MCGSSNKDCRGKAYKFADYLHIAASAPRGHVLRDFFSVLVLIFLFHFQDKSSANSIFLAAQTNVNQATLNA